MNTIEANIFKLYLFQALRWFLIVMPVQVLFFQENGLSMKEVMLLQTVFSVSLIIFELPSGYLSDTIGRKTTLTIGAMLSFIGFAVFSVSYDFWSLLIGEIILGVAGSFVSGTDSAILYDSLKQINKERDYKRAEGKLFAISNFSEASASVLGGFIALISLRTNVYIETFILFLAIPVAFSIVEPERKKLDRTQGTLKNISRIIRFSIHESREVKYLILYSGVISASTLTMVWFIQPYMEYIGIPVVLFGIIWALLNFSVGIFSLSAHITEKKLGIKASLAIIALLPSVAYFLLGFFPGIWALGFILIFYFVRGFSSPVLKDYLNVHLSSEMRATVLSITSLTGRVLFSVIGPLTGYISDKYTIETAMLSAGIIYLLLCSISYLLLVNNISVRKA